MMATDANGDESTGRPIADLFSDGDESTAHQPAAENSPVHQTGSGHPAAYDDPSATLVARGDGYAGDDLMIHAAAIESFGFDDVDYLKAWTNPDDRLLGLAPTDADDRDGYPLTRYNGVARISAGWLRHEFDFRPPPGRYAMRHDDSTGLVVVDFSDELPQGRYDSEGEVDRQ